MDAEGWERGRSPGSLHVQRLCGRFLTTEDAEDTEVRISPPLFPPTTYGMRSCRPAEAGRTRIASREGEGKGALAESPHDLGERYYPLAMKYGRLLGAVAAKMPFDVIPVRPNPGETPLTHGGNRP